VNKKKDGNQAFGASELGVKRGGKGLAGFKITAVVVYIKRETKKQGKKTMTRNPKWSNGSIPDIRITDQGTLLEGKTIPGRSDGGKYKQVSNRGGFPRPRKEGL